MNILLSGGSGFIGSNLIRKLLPKHNLFLILQKNSPNWRIKNLIKNCHVIYADITDIKNLHKNTSKFIHSIDATVHLAAYGVSMPRFDFDQGIRTNISGTLNLLELSFLNGVKKFINTGSCFEYAQSKKPYKETNPVSPQSLYGGIKAASTILVSAYAKKNSYNAFTLRLFTPFGPFETKNRFIPSVILSVLEGKRLMASNPNSVRDYIYIDDVVNAYVKSIETTKKLDGEIINIGTGKQYKLIDMVKIIEKKSNTSLRKQVKTNILWKAREETRQMEYHNWRSSIFKAQKILNWKPKISIDDGLSLDLEWFKQFFYLYK